LKAVILAAGAPRNLGWFPSEQAKCLYQVDGEIVLSRMVRCLREAGIQDIRIVVGYYKQNIKRFIEEHGLNLEVVYNPRWKIDAVASLLEGIRGVDDDVLIIFGDCVIRTKVIKDFLVHQAPLVWIKLKNSPHLPLGGEVENRVHIVKVAKEKLGIFDKTYENMENCMRLHDAYDGISYGTGIALTCGLIETLRQNGPVGEVLVHPVMKDIDLYRQTDKGKEHWGIK